MVQARLETLSSGVVASRVLAGDVWAGLYTSLSSFGPNRIRSQPAEGV